MQKTRIYTPEEIYDPIPLPERNRQADAAMIEHTAAFFQNMARRHSTREFSGEAVPKQVIENAILTAGRGPSGANHQPWHFCVVGPGEKRRLIREAAEAEERAFYDGRGGEEWLAALRPLGTDTEKPFLEIAPWLIVVFAERYGIDGAGENYKNYYVPESVGIACGFLIASLHQAGLATLTHTPNPMRFLNQVCQRPDNEKAYLILVVGHAAEDAVVPRKSLVKKPLDEIASFL